MREKNDREKDYMFTKGGVFFFLAVVLYQDIDTNLYDLIFIFFSVFVTTLRIDFVFTVQ